MSLYYYTYAYILYSLSPQVNRLVVCYYIHIHYIILSPRVNRLVVCYYRDTHTLYSLSPRLIDWLFVTMHIHNVHIHCILYPPRLIDWLDEPSPGSFRQVQISFSSRIPQAIPVGDAMSMSPDLLLYCNYGRQNDKNTLKESESQSINGNKDVSNHTHKMQVSNW